MNPAEGKGFIDWAAMKPAPKPAQKLETANRAKAILDNPMYEQAYEGVRTALFERIEKCSLTDTQTAEHLRICLKLLRDVHLNLTSSLNSGKVEAFRLAEDEARKKNPLRNLFR